MRRPRSTPAGAGRATPSAALLLALLTAAAAPGAAADDGDGPPPPAAPDSWYARSAVAALQAADATRDPGAAGVAGLNSALADGVGRLHGLAPGWLRRSEIELRLADDLRPRYEVMTVQPLYRSRSGRDTVFVQGRLASGGAGEEAAAGDAALGYRHLVHGDRILVGANGFYDADLADGRRLGVGAEVRSRPLELTAAYYGALPDGERDAAAAPEGAAGATGADPGGVLAGYDVAVGAQVPWLPWVRVYGERYRREPGLLRPGLDGERFGLRLAPLEPVRVEVGGESEGDSAHPGYFARFRYTRALGASPAPPAGPLIDRDPLAFEDVSGRRLDRVRR